MSSASNSDLSSKTAPQTERILHSIGEQNKQFKKGGIRQLWPAIAAGAPTSKNATATNSKQRKKLQQQSVISSDLSSTLSSPLLSNTNNINNANININTNQALTSPKWQQSRTTKGTNIASAGFSSQSTKKSKFANTAAIHGSTTFSPDQIIRKVKFDSSFSSSKSAKKHFKPSSIKPATYKASPTVLPVSANSTSKTKIKSILKVKRVLVTKTKPGTNEVSRKTRVVQQGGVIQEREAAALKDVTKLFTRVPLSEGKPLIVTKKTSLVKKASRLEPILTTSSPAADTHTQSSAIEKVLPATQFGAKVRPIIAKALSEQLNSPNDLVQIQSIDINTNNTTVPLTTPAPPVKELYRKDQRKSLDIETNNTTVPLATQAPPVKELYRRDQSKSLDIETNNTTVPLATPAPPVKELNHKDKGKSRPRFQTSARTLNTVDTPLRSFSPISAKSLGLFGYCFTKRRTVYAGRIHSVESSSYSVQSKARPSSEPFEMDSTQKKDNTNTNESGNDKNNENDRNDDNNENDRNDQEERRDENEKNEKKTEKQKDKLKESDKQIKGQKEHTSDDNTPSTSKDGNSIKKRKINEESTAKTNSEAVAASGPSTSTQSTEEDKDKEDDKDPKKKKNRCAECRKKVGLTGFLCRCGGLYCAVHRYSDKHDCTFNYREHGAQEIRRNNPVVVGEKIQKI